MAICTKCSTEKPLEEFVPSRRNKNGRMAYCRVCSAAHMRKWRSENKERYLAHRRAKWAENHEDELEKQRQSRRARKPATKAKIKAAAEKWRSENKERVRESHREWHKKNPHKMPAYNAVKKARKKGAPRIERIYRQEIYERDAGRCHLCRRKVSATNFHLDHLIPLSKGGPHTVENLRVAHPRCNMRRQAGLVPAQLLLVG